MGTRYEVSEQTVTSWDSHSDRQRAGGTANRHPDGRTHRQTDRPTDRLTDVQTQPAGAQYCHLQEQCGDQ